MQKQMEFVAKSELNFLTKCLMIETKYFDETTIQNQRHVSMCVKLSSNLSLKAFKCVNDIRSICLFVPPGTLIFDISLPYILFT